MEGQKGTAIDDGSAHGGIKVAPLGLKLRRGISTAKKGGPCTPVPSWKLEDNVDLETKREAEPAPAVVEPNRSSVSARKLGANLWEIQDLVPESMSGRRGNKIRRHRDGKAVDDGGGGANGLVLLGVEDRPQSAGSLRKHAIASLIKQHKLNEANVRALQPVSPASYTSSMEIAALDQAITPSSSKDPRGKVGEVGYSLKTSTELLKVLNRIWSLEEQNAANVSLVKALKMELEKARARIQELTHEQHEYRHDIDNLVKQVAEDKMMRKNKEQQKIKTAVQLIRNELDDERHLRRRSESLHRKLGKELSEVKTAFLKAVKDLEVKRKVNGLLEDLCDEFAEGIRDYEQEVRDLRQNPSRDCVNKVDRLIVHISEAWLDERMQMKIAEAHGNLPEKTTATERLRTEIEAFLHNRRSRVSKIDTIFHTEQKRDNNLQRQSLESVHLNGATSAPQDGDDDSFASDLHCFELNMTSGNNENHDALKKNDQEEVKDLYSMSIENLDSGRKSKCYDKKSTSLNAKDQGSSSSRTQYFGHTKMAGHDGQQDETKMQQKSDSYRSQEILHETKLKSPHMLRTNCMNGQAEGSFSEITECCKGDHDNIQVEVSQGYFSREDQFASVGKDDDLLEICHTASPIQKWKFRHGTPDVKLSESAVKLAQGIKESTLKAKLLEARKEGRHARLKTSNSAPIDGARQ